MLNQVTLVGRMTADPELRESTTGRSFCFINLAAMRSFKNQETNEFETDFIDISLWGITAESVVKHCGKGSAIAVRGRLANRVLDFPGEQTFRTIAVVGERVSFIQLKAPDSETDNEINDLDQLILDDFPIENADNNL
jgi:single-strand DNA-binding protein